MTDIVSDIVAGAESLLGGFATAASNILAKVEQGESIALADLEADEQIVASDVVGAINFVETNLNTLKAQVQQVPIVGTQAAAVITGAEALLDNLKAVGIAIESGSVQQPGSESNV